MSGSILKDAHTYRALFAEFLGTFFLVFIAVGTAKGINLIPSATDGLVHLLTGSLCAGFTVSSIVDMIGHVSGCHINPAITVAMLVARKISIVMGILYIIVQCLGGTFAALLLRILVMKDSESCFGVNSLPPHSTPLQGFVVEFIVSLFFLLTIFALTDGKRTDVKGSVALSIGLSLSACIFFAAPLSSASLNPARTLGPALLSGCYQDHWVWWLGPCTGSATAALIYKGVFRAGLRPQPKLPQNDYEMCSKEDRN